MLLEIAARLAGFTGRFAGRVVLPAGGAAFAFFTTKKYLELLRDDPDFKRIQSLEEEKEKWAAILSMIGRKPFGAGYTASENDGGAINALGLKKKEEALGLIQKAADTLYSIINLAGMPNFDAQRDAMAQELMSIYTLIKNPKARSFKKYQQRLSELAGALKSTETGRNQTYDQAIEKRLNELRWKKLGFLGKGALETGKKAVGIF